MLFTPYRRKDDEPDDDGAGAGEGSNKGGAESEAGKDAAGKITVCPFFNAFEHKLNMIPLYVHVNMSIIYTRSYLVAN